MEKTFADCPLRIHVAADPPMHKNLRKTFTEGSNAAKFAKISPVKDSSYRVHGCTTCMYMYTCRSTSLAFNSLHALLQCNVVPLITSICVDTTQ